MWALFVLVVLCLGYIQSSSTPFGRANLRGIQGWEAYAHLAKNGLGLLFQGAMITALAFMCSLALAFLWSILSWIFSWEHLPYKFVTDAFSYDVYRGVTVWEMLTVFCSYFIHVGNQKKDNGDWKEAFKNKNAALNMIMDSAENQTPLRVSLKSRKVYIGIVESEKFTNSDLDNIALIPYLSGHREKDTLQMILDHNYFDVYKKNGIVDDLPKLSLFRIAIRMDEIESMSLFDISYFGDFQEDTD